jgi:hypothetical protein
LLSTSEELLFGIPIETASDLIPFVLLSLLSELATQIRNNLNEHFLLFGVPAFAFLDFGVKQLGGLVLQNASLFRFKDFKQQTPLIFGLNKIFVTKSWTLML